MKQENKGVIDYPTAVITAINRALAPSLTTSWQSKTHPFSQSLHPSYRIPLKGAEYRVGSGRQNLVCLDSIQCENHLSELIFGFLIHA